MVNQVSKKDLPLCSIAIVGAGFMGKTHAAAYAKMKDVSIAAIVDNDKMKASELSAKYSGIGTDSFDVVLNNPSIDIVDINIPPFLHREYILKAIQAGKHVICEKPIALTIEDAEIIKETAKHAKTKFMVAHGLRFSPAYATLKRLIANNELGRPLSATAYRIDTMPPWGGWFSNASKSGGAAINIHIHDIDFLNWCFGKPRTIHSAGVESTDGGINHILSIVNYNDGVNAFVEASFMMPKEYPFTQYLRVLCENGVAEIALRKQMEDEKTEKEHGLTIYKKGVSPIKPSLDGMDTFYDELRYFVDRVQNDSDIEICSAEEACTALKTCLGARQSVQTNQTVSLID